MIDGDRSGPSAGALGPRASTNGQARTALDRMRLDGKVALVTGGSQGLGLAMAEALAQAGAEVAIAARRADRLAAAKERVDAHGSSILTITADLSDVDAARGAVDDVFTHFGRVDVLVTAAGTQLRKPALEVTPDEWDAVVAVNLRGVYFTCQQAARHMLAQQPLDEGPCRGKIINVASLTAVGAWPDVSVYGMTKGGVVQMTKAMAFEWGVHGINVNAIGPGTFPTELTEALYNDPARTEGILRRVPLGRPGEADDVGGAAVLLASSASDYITGQVIWVDGGWLVT